MDLASCNWLSCLSIDRCYCVLCRKTRSSSLESVLLQFIALAIGCGVSYWVGKTSVKEAAEEIIKPHVKSAFRRLIFLYLILRKAANIIESSDSSESQEEYEMLLARLEEIVAAQLITADHALEDWNDIVPEEVEGLKQDYNITTHKEDQQ